MTKYFVLILFPTGSQADPFSPTTRPVFTRLILLDHPFSPSVFSLDPFSRFLLTRFLLLSYSIVFSLSRGVEPSYLKMLLAVQPPGLRASAP